MEQGHERRYKGERKKRVDSERDERKGKDMSAANKWKGIRPENARTYNQSGLKVRDNRERSRTCALFS